MSEMIRTRANTARRITTWDILVVALAVAVLAVVVVTLGRALRQWKPSPALRSREQVGSLALAMLQYAEDKGRLPPAFICGHDGRPLLSWRVLLLPYLEQQDLYRQFNLSEPWDGPTNCKLLARMPEVFADKRRRGQKPERYHTFFRVFVGKGTAFDDPDGDRFPDDITDGQSDSLLVFEAAEAVPWTKPEGIPYAADKPLPPMRRQGSYAGMADGIALFIWPEVREEDLRRAITRKGEEIRTENWNSGGVSHLIDGGWSP